MPIEAQGVDYTKSFITDLISFPKCSVYSRPEAMSTKSVGLGNSFLGGMSGTLPC